MPRTILWYWKRNICHLPQCWPHWMKNQMSAGTARPRAAFHNDIHQDTITQTCPIIQILKWAEILNRWNNLFNVINTYWPSDRVHHGKVISAIVLPFQMKCKPSFSNTDICSLTWKIHEKSMCSAQFRILNCECVVWLSMKGMRQVHAEILDRQVSRTRPSPTYRATSCIINCYLNCSKWHKSVEFNSWISWHRKGKNADWRSATLPPAMPSRSMTIANRSFFGRRGEIIWREGKRSWTGKRCTLGTIGSNISLVVLPSEP